MTLDLVENNSVLIIQKINLKEENLINLFLDSGIFPGRKIKLISKNKSQNKVLLEISNIILAIRFENAKCIEVSLE